VARFGFTITKRVSFRNVQQEFHNTYYYQLTPWTPTDSVLSGMIDEIVVTEKKLHSTDVTFVRAQCWSAGGTPAENQMRVQKALSGTGNGTTSTTLDRERAILIRWPAGVDIRGRPVYLRKWFHICGDFQATPFLLSAPVQQNTAEIATAARDKAAAFAEELREIGVTETVDLCSRSGRETTGGAQCHAYLEHHQMGDMWRG
jgi:hypothetical protein